MAGLDATSMPTVPPGAGRIRTARRHVTETRLADVAGVREFWFRTTTLRVIQLSRMGLSHLTGSGHSLAVARRDTDRMG